MLLENEKIKDANDIYRQYHFCFLVLQLKSIDHTNFAYSLQFGTSE